MKILDSGFRRNDERGGFQTFYDLVKFDRPTLIIHAQNDHIISFAEGQALYDACPATDKRLLMIPGANHNDILVRGMKEYLEAVKMFVDRLGREEK
jgi:fermentation-respiration switch protein FrsA (DUF1100 family)